MRVHSNNGRARLATSYKNIKTQNLVHIRRSCREELLKTTLSYKKKRKHGESLTYYQLWTSYPPKVPINIFWMVDCIDAMKALCPE
jgi:hypothetical protein